MQDSYPRENNFRLEQVLRHPKVKAYPVKNLQSGTHTPPLLYFLQDRHWLGPGPQQPLEHKWSHMWPSLTENVNRKKQTKKQSASLSSWTKVPVSKRSTLTHHIDFWVCCPWHQQVCCVDVGGNCWWGSASSSPCQGSTASCSPWCTRCHHLCHAASVTPGMSRRRSSSPKERSPWKYEQWKNMWMNIVCQRKLTF